MFAETEEANAGRKSRMRGLLSPCRAPALLRGENRLNGASQRTCFRRARPRLGACVCAPLCVLGCGMLWFGYREGCWDSSHGFLVPFSLALTAERLLIWLPVALSQQIQKNGMWRRWGDRCRLRS